jgi:hypothetical protein
VVLGLALLIGGVTGALDDADFPRPVGRVLLVAVGLALIGLGALIWTGRVPLKALVLGNAVSALAGIIWLAAVSGFSTAGTTVVAITVAGLVVLAAAQAATLRA